MSDTLSAVEKPGRNTKERIFFSSMRSTSSWETRPFCTAFLAIFVGSIPRPSSSTVMTMLLCSRNAEQDQCPLGRLAVGLALFLRLDSVVDSVAEQVDESVPDLVQETPVNFYVVPLHGELDVLLALLADVPDHAREALEYEIHRDHPGTQHDVLHLGHQAGVVLQRLLEFPVLKVGGDLVDPYVVDHDLAHQVQELVQQLALHPNGVPGGDGRFLR